MKKTIGMGKRRYGYGGYKYIPGRLTKVAKKIINKFKLNNSSKILRRRYVEKVFYYLR